MLICYAFLSECHLVFPATVINGNAVSKTFQILYRNEDVTLNDIILFKVHALVDAVKVIFSFIVSILTLASYH